MSEPSALAAILPWSWILTQLAWITWCTTRCMRIRPPLHWPVQRVVGPLLLVDHFLHAWAADAVVFKIVWAASGLVFYSLWLLFKDDDQDRRGPRRRRVRLRVRVPAVRPGSVRVPA